MDMVAFIARSIMKAADTSLTAGQAKYRGYLVRTTIYLAWKTDIDNILIVEGYEDVIVTQ